MSTTTWTNAFCTVSKFLWNSFEDKTKTRISPCPNILLLDTLLQLHLLIHQSLLMHALLELHLFIIETPVAVGGSAISDVCKVIHNLGVICSRARAMFSVQDIRGCRRQTTRAQPVRGFQPPGRPTRQLLVTGSMYRTLEASKWSGAPVVFSYSWLPVYFRWGVLLNFIDC